MTCTPAALTLPGYLDLPLDTQDVTASPHYRLTEGGQVPEGTLILGTSKDGPLRLECTDARYWRRIEAEARQNAQFLEDAQRSAAA